MIRDKTENPTIYGGSHEHESVVGSKRKVRSRKNGSKLPYQYGGKRTKRTSKQSGGKLQNYGGIKTTAHQFGSTSGIIRRENTPKFGW